MWRLNNADRRFSVAWLSLWLAAIKRASRDIGYRDICEYSGRAVQGDLGAHLAGTTKREACYPVGGKRGHKPVKNPFKMDQRSQLVGWTIKITEGVMVSGDRSAIISISGTRARKDQSIHEWSKAPRISITGRHYHARKSRSLAAWWGLLAAGLTGGALTAANRQAGEAPDQLRPRLPVARRPPVLTLAGPHRTPHRAVGTATVVGRESGRYASRIRFFSLL